MTKLHAYSAPANEQIDITHYAPLVKKIAAIMMSRLPASVEIDDLIQVGLMGLIEAAQQFDSAQGVLFETFASQRVRGAMLDELRRLDWLPRQARKQSKQIEEAISQLEQHHGRAPREQEIAEHLALTLDAYQSMLQDCKGHQLLYYEDFSSDDHSDDSSAFVDHIVDERPNNPLELLGNSHFHDALVDVIQQLPEREQLVMSLYYEQELNLKEIGAVLDVTESRISQLHSQAVARIRAKLKAWL